MYLRPDALAEDLGWLRSHGYDIYEFDCVKWKSEKVVHQDLKHVLRFPDHYGHNLDALSDCIGDLFIPEAGGAALVFRGFDAYARESGAKVTPWNRPYAEVILDILACASRFLLLTGRRLLLIIQSHDPRITFDKLGCVRAAWNPREWQTRIAACRGNPTPQSLPPAPSLPPHSYPAPLSLPA